jgi:glycosyltransferase involved in cell wall biosynthesis
MSKPKVFLKRLAKKNKHVYRAARRAKRLIRPGSAPANLEIYDFRKYYPSPDELAKQKKDYRNFKLQPKISVIVPTYNTNIRFLKECMDSVIAQSYPNWELCIADDASPKAGVVQKIKQYAEQDQRIKLVERKHNGHISLASNSAIKIAGGEYLALLDHDDVLWPNALYEIVKIINSNPEADFIYTDEDKIDEAGRIHSYPFFKPDWSPEFLESCNYITHFACIRKSAVDRVGGFRKGYEGAQDWDLFIRVSETTSKIRHIPKVLYSWRVHEASTAQDTDAKPYVYEAQKKLLQDHVARIGAKGSVHQGLIWQHSIIDYEVEGLPGVTVVVYGGQADDATARLMKNSGYPSDSVRIETLAKLTPGALAGLLKVDKSDYFVLLPAETAKISDKWLYKFIADSQRRGIGIVGGRLLSPDGQTLYSAGLGIGLGKYYLPLLNGEPIEDNHYMRALHGKSRRNVLAVEAPLIVGREVLERIDLDRLEQDYLITDLCLTAVAGGFRCVYSPYIASSLHSGSAAGQELQPKAAASFRKKWAGYIEYDPFVNPNYLKTNGRLEVS